MCTMHLVLLRAGLALASLVTAVDGEHEVGPEQFRCALRHFACAGCCAGGRCGWARALGAWALGVGQSPEGQNALRTRATSSARTAAQARAASSRAAASRSASARSSEPLVALQTQARARQAPCARSHFSITSHVRTGGRRHSPGGGERPRGLPERTGRCGRRASRQRRNALGHRHCRRRDGRRAGRCDGRRDGRL